MASLLDCMLVILGLLLDYAAGLQCYDCHNVTDVNSCVQTVTCLPNQSCYMEARQQTLTQWTYSLSCQDNNHCGPMRSSRSNTGTSAGYLSKLLIRRDATTCNECCSKDYCNTNLCNHKSPSTCADDQSMDCARMNSIFSVCTDVHKAKLVCPKFCNLCNIVDGNWNVWSSWSVCDVTCGTGTQTRHRTCTNPAPENGGLNCVGEALDIKTCILDRCPVHGGWSQWSPWGSCSATCDVGMQRRDRSCSNPYPSLGGDHCFGDSRDDMICYMPGCTNGKWSSWQPWSSCSATCFGGHRNRYRVCSNPYPSLLGHYCEGSNQEMDFCNLISCGDGGWSAWQSWSSCSQTCGGEKTRIRACDNPPPSFLGHYCSGSREDREACNNLSCVFSGSNAAAGSAIDPSASQSSANQFLNPPKFNPNQSYPVQDFYTSPPLSWSSWQQGPDPFGPHGPDPFGPHGPDPSGPLYSAVGKRQ
ncbi:coadhesin-like isoform X2 [Dreissena polymorpha]|uniref:coadhesin-like isoform X2 n=1 Tax=Dreissena polymorpha TaxID=45954 RepID=UPI002264A03F|nr:coadhesin-like isoform X2 [Dreissena polymorpha]